MTDTAYSSFDQIQNRWLRPYGARRLHFWNNSLATMRTCMAKAACGFVDEIKHLKDEPNRERCQRCSTSVKNNGLKFAS